LVRTDEWKWIEVAKSDEVAERGRLVLDLDNKTAGIFRIGGELFAYWNICAHMGGPICQGLMVPRIVEQLDGNKAIVGSKFDEEDMQIACPWHGAEYSIRTGAHAGDGKMKLKKLPVCEEEGIVYVGL
tara:strand:- start:28871 stop:29254 length:384 start_codon:yes stop_codon:yes gene_type:complete